MEEAEAVAGEDWSKFRIEVVKGVKQESEVMLSEAGQVAHIVTVDSGGGLQFPVAGQAESYAAQGLTLMAEKQITQADLEKMVSGQLVTATPISIDPSYLAGAGDKVISLTSEHLTSLIADQQLVVGQLAAAADPLGDGSKPSDVPENLSVVKEEIHADVLTAKDLNRAGEELVVTTTTLTAAAGGDAGGVYVEDAKPAEDVGGGWQAGRRASGRKLINCSLCHYVTNKRSHLNDHVRMVHLRVKTVCHLCGKEFANINQHMRVVHKTLKSGINSKSTCHECKKDFFDLNKHMAKAHQRYAVYDWVCKFCNLRMKSKFILTRHVQRRHQEKQECGECGKRFSNLDVHIKKVHRSGKSKPQMCPRCRRIFRKLADLRRHSFYCNKPLPPDNADGGEAPAAAGPEEDDCENEHILPDVVTEDYDDLGADTGEDNLEAADEEMEGPSAAELAAAAVSEIVSAPPDDDPPPGVNARAADDSKMDPDTMLLAQLSKTLLNSDSQNFIQEEPNNMDEDYYAQPGGGSSADKAAERAAARKREKKGKAKRLPCPLCNEPFKNLDRHLRKKHAPKRQRPQGATTHQCELCGYATNRVTNYKMHVKMVHLKSKTVCHKCGKEYSNINQHMRVVHKTVRSGRNEKVQCLECNNSYYDIQQHMRRTHKHPVVKEFFCFTCGHKFTKQANLRRHEQRIHLGVRYECLVCEKVVSDIDKHMQVHREPAQSLDELLASHNLTAAGSNDGGDKEGGEQEAGGDKEAEAKGAGEGEEEKEGAEAGGPSEVNAAVHKDPPSKPVSPAAPAGDDTADTDGEAPRRRRGQSEHIGVRYECLVCEKVVPDIDKHMQAHKEESAEPSPAKVTAVNDNVPPPPSKPAAVSPAAGKEGQLPDDPGEVISEKRQEKEELMSVSEDGKEQ